MANVPLSSTNLTLLKGVPFQSDYKHTRWFDSMSSQTAFFNSRETGYTTENFNKVKMNNENFISVPFDYDDIMNCNYMYFVNDSKRYYCFIESFEYVRKDLTKVNFVLDVLQTYMFDFEFQPSFIAREHQTNMNTLNEGLDYGSAYDTVATEKFIPNDGMQFLVVLSKSPLHNDSDDIEPGLIGVPQPLHFYVIPYWNSFTSGDMNTPTTSIGLSGTQEFMSSPLSVIKEMYDNENAVNNVVSMYITQDPGFQMRTYARGTETGDVLGRLVLDNNNNQTMNVVEIGSLKMIHVEKIRQFQYRSERVVSNYNEKFFQSEPKLTRSPYAKIILDDQRGNRIELDPEKIYGSHLNLNVKGGIGHNNIVQYAVENYNYTMGSDISYENELVNETSIINSKPQDIAILTDHLASYMQGNKNSLQHQQRNFGLSAGNTLVNTGMSMGTNLASAGFGIASAGQGLLGTMMSIQGVQANLKDIETSPPALNNMGSSTHFDSGHNYNGIIIIFKQIKSEYRRKISDYFKMFGYKQNEVKIPNLRSRNNYNYIQTESCVLKGNINNQDMNTLRGVFDNGITLWHTNDVGNYNLSNSERG